MAVFNCIFLGGGGAFLVCLFRKLTLHIMRQNAAIIFFLAAMAFLPIGWILITAGHAYGHYWFTYKEFAISSFALLSLGIYLKNLTCSEISEREAEEKQDLQ